MPSLAAILDIAGTAPAPQRAVPGPLLIGDIATARAGVPELLIQMARAENRGDPKPQP
jgi:hypothetical protein